MEQTCKIMLQFQSSESQPELQPAFMLECLHVTCDTVTLRILCCAVGHTACALLVSTWQQGYHRALAAFAIPCTLNVGSESIQGMLCL